MAIHKSELMLSQLYDELNSYYNHMVSVDNIVRRISELMSFVSLTEVGNHLHDYSNHIYLY